MNHLADEQIADYLAGTADAPTRAHLDACSECRGELDHASALIARAKSAVAASSDRPPAFWTRQRAGILDRLAAPRLRYRAWAAAAIFATIMVGSMLVIRVEHRRPASQPVQQVRATISDDALFAEVNATLQERVPPALEPAALLIDSGDLATDNSDPVLTRR